MVKESFKPLLSPRREGKSRRRKIGRVWRVVSGVEQGEGEDWEWRKLIDGEEVLEEGPELTLINQRNIQSITIFTIPTTTSPIHPYLVYYDEVGQLKIIDLIRKVSRVIYKTTKDDSPLVQLEVGFTRTTTTTTTSPPSTAATQVYLMGLVDGGNNSILRIWQLDLISNLKRRNYQPPTRELHLTQFTSHPSTFTHLVTLSGYVVVGTEDLGTEESSFSTGTPTQPKGIGAQRLHLLRLDRAGPPTPVTFFSFPKLTFHPQTQTHSNQTEPQYEWREHDLIELITTTSGWLVGLLRADSRIQLIAWSPDRLQSIARRVTKEPTTLHHPPSHLSTPFTISKFNLLTSIDTTIHVLQPNTTRTFQLTPTPDPTTTSPHLLTPTIHPNSLPTSITHTTTTTILVTSDSQPSPHLVTLSPSPQSSPTFPSVSFHPLTISSSSSTTTPSTPSPPLNPLDALFPTTPLPSYWGGRYRNQLHLYSLPHPDRSLSDLLSPHLTTPSDPLPPPLPINLSPSPTPFPHVLLHQLSQPPPPPPQPTLTTNPVPPAQVLSSPPAHSFPPPPLDPTSSSLLRHVTQREIDTLTHRIAELELRWSPTD